MNIRLLTTSGIFSIIVAFILVNGLSDRMLSQFSIDLTEEGLYTLSEGSRSTIQSLEEPVTLKFFYSKTEGDSYPVVKLFGTWIGDLLKEYEQVSGGSIEVEVIDPRPDSEDEEWAERYGVTPFALPSGEKVYLGLVGINGEGLEDVIPAFNLNRQEYLEYDITKLLYSLNSAVSTKVGVLSTLNLEGGNMPGTPPSRAAQEPEWVILSQLKKLAEVVILPTELTTVPDDVSVLFVIHPRGLSEGALYAIDQFVLRGGNLFLAVDPFAMSENIPRDPNNPMAAFMVDRASDINSITKNWGFTLREGKVVADRKLATQVATQPGKNENFAAWLTFRDLASQTIINRNDIVSSSLENIMFAWPGAFKISSVDGLTIEPLLQTSNDAGLIEEKDLRFVAEKPQSVLEKHTPGGEQLPVAVRVSGDFKSSFDAKPDSIVSDAPHIPSSVMKGSVIAVSDVDFLADAYSVVRQSLGAIQFVSLLNDNLTFATNAIDNLKGDANLIGLRSRGRFSRPFEKVQEIELAAQEKYKSEEERFQAELNSANQRLASLQAGDQSSSSVMNEALLAEIDQLREQKRLAQQRLREARRKMREDKESLGTFLFLLNTFLVPLLLIIAYFSLVIIRKPAS